MRSETTRRIPSAASSFLNSCVSRGSTTGRRSSSTFWVPMTCRRRWERCSTEALCTRKRSRHELFTKKEYPKPVGSEAATGGAVSGTLNGKPFKSIGDADPRIGPRLEVFAGGSYLWMNFEHIASLEMEKPRRLRDLLWTPARLRGGPALKDTETGGNPSAGADSIRLAGFRGCCPSGPRHRVGGKRCRSARTGRSKNVARRR